MFGHSLRVKVGESHETPSVPQQFKTLYTYNDSGQLIRGLFAGMEKTYDSKGSLSPACPITAVVRDFETYFHGNAVRTNSRFWTAIKLPSTIPNPSKCRQTHSADRSAHPIDFV